jgi:dTDP-4-amino-4,6-dideoxygalactose transaminase
MSEVCAAMGLTSLESVHELINLNERNHKAYRIGLYRIPGITLLERNDGERHNYQYVVIEVNESLYGRTRDELVEILHSHNVIARKYFWPGCHRMEPYVTEAPNAYKDLVETERVAARVVVLPTGQTVNADMISTICRIISASVS